MFLSFLILASMALLPFFSHKQRWEIAKRWGDINLRLCKYLCGLDYEITGLENIPEKKCILFVKHSSVYEIFILLKHFSPSSWVGKYELMYIPIFRGVFKKFKLIPVKRGHGATEIEKVRAMGKERLVDGNWIIIFPEGTRMHYNKSKRYGLSGSILAKETGSMVLPISHNAGKYWKRRGWLKHAGKISFIVGKPYETDGMELDEINNTAKKWIDLNVKA
tara:strand:+ start:446 stop:1105 length:660 start_codon:yes stop_codon:yes gene_type:complete